MLHKSAKAVLLVFCAIVLANCSGSQAYWSKVCLAPDEKTFGTAGLFYGAALIDAQNGTLVKKIDEPLDEVNCFPNGEVVAFSEKEALWLNTGARAQSASVALGDFRIDEDEVFYLKRNKKSVRRSKPAAKSPTEYEYVQVNDGPPLLVIRQSGKALKEEDYMKLTPDRFPAISGGDESIFEVMPIKVIEDRKLMVAAGFPADAAGQEKRAWGFFAIDFGNKSVTILSEAIPGENAPGFHQGSRFSASADGKLVAGNFLTHAGGSAVIVFGLPAMTERFRTQFESNCIDLKFDFNQDSSLLALATGGNCQPGGTAKLQVFNLTDKQLLWEQAMPSRPIFLRFLQDDSLLAAGSYLSAARYGGRDGAIFWQQSY